MDRRDFMTGLIGTGALAAIPVTDGAASGETSWKSGSIEHILATVNDRRLLLKASFQRPISNPLLVVGGRRIAGQRTDTEGRFWEFDARNDWTTRSSRNSET